MKQKRDHGQAMTPDELTRYRELKDMIKKASGEESKTNQVRTPGNGPSRGILKTPDEKPRDPKPRTSVTL